MFWTCADARCGRSRPLMAFVTSAWEPRRARSMPPWHSLPSAVLRLCARTEPAAQANRHRPLAIAGWFGPPMGPLVRAKMATRAMMMMMIMIMTMMMMMTMTTIIYMSF